jgi:PhnB protein
MQVNAYLLFNGQCEEAFKFYESCFGARIDGMLKHAGSPAEAHVPPEWGDKILHARLLVGDTVVMASDAPPGHYEKPQGFSVNLQLKDADEAERIFKALSENGTVKMPLAQTFWAKRFGMCTDQFGIPWMINCG